MSKKSKKKLAKAQAMMDEARRLKAEIIKQQVAKTGSWNNLPTTSTPLTQSTIPTTAGRPMLSVRNKHLIYGGIGALVLLAAILFLGSRYLGGTTVNDKTAEQEEDTVLIQPSEATIATGTITVVEKWELPAELKEISANVFIDADRIACVQDNDGTIFTYNLSTKRLEHRLNFGPRGDYEGLALVNGTYYVLRVNGMLYEVVPSGGGKPRVRQYQLPLSLENNPEPMFYDQPNNRLLIAVKETDPSGQQGKGVYSFDLGTKTMTLEPVLMLTDTADGAPPADQHLTAGIDGTGKNRNNTSLSPSEIAINQETGEIYVLNGPEAEFMITDATGMVIAKYQLDKKDFPQPEGMCFSPSGELYISSEGKARGKGAGIIARVKLP